jgi:hypothetical protein
LVKALNEIKAPAQGGEAGRRERLINSDMNDMEKFNVILTE